MGSTWREVEGQGIVVEDGERDGEDWGYGEGREKKEEDGERGGGRGERCGGRS